MKNKKLLSETKSSEVIAFILDQYAKENIDRDLNVCADMDIVPGNFMLNSAGVKPMEGARYIFALVATLDAIVSEQIVSVPIKPMGPCCSVEPVAIIIP